MCLPRLSALYGGEELEEEVLVVEQKELDRSTEGVHVYIVLAAKGMYCIVRCSSVPASTASSVTYSSVRYST